MKYIILTKRGLTAITAVTLSALLIVFGICGRKSALSSAAAEEGKRLLPIYCVETDEKKLQSPLTLLGEPTTRKGS